MLRGNDETFTEVFNMVGKMFCMFGKVFDMGGEMFVEKAIPRRG